MPKLKIATIRPNSSTAGLSPNNNLRTEIFFSGCRIAREGHPCPGCFNKELWDDTGAIEVTAEEILQELKEAGNKYITIVGGEPMDQEQGLLYLLSLLKEHGYHTVLITHYTMADLLYEHGRILDNCNVIIDGPYDASQRIFDECQKPGIYQVIGSRNQEMWHCCNGAWNRVDKENGNLDEVYSS